MFFPAIFSFSISIFRSTLFLEKFLVSDGFSHLCTGHKYDTTQSRTNMSSESCGRKKNILSYYQGSVTHFLVDSMHSKALFRLEYAFCHFSYFFRFADCVACVLGRVSIIS